MSFCAVQGGAMAVGGVDNRFFEQAMRNLSLPCECTLHLMHPPALHMSLPVFLLHA